VSGLDLHFGDSGILPPILALKHDAERFDEIAACAIYSDQTRNTARQYAKDFRTAADRLEALP
jgi:hypothetical protein